MKLTAIVALCLGLTTTVTRFGQAKSDAPVTLSQSPLKFRVNTNVLKNAFHTRDQETLNAFTNIKVKTEEDSAFSNVVLTIKPIDSVPFDDFDYTLNL